MDRAQKRNPDLAVSLSMCLTCKSNAETSDQFFHYPFAQKGRNYICNHFDCAWCPPKKNEDGLLDLISGWWLKKSKIVWTKSRALLSFLRKERSYACFSDKVHFC